MQSPRKIVSCGTCPWRISSDGSIEVLLVKPFSDQNNWGIPKGHIEEGEDARECAVRETFEETGVTVNTGRELITVTTRFDKTVKNVVSFLATPTNAEQVAYPADGENVEVKWWPIQSLPPLHRYQRMLLDHVIEILQDRTNVG